MSNLPTYLGDGVYLDADGFQLWLAVGDHRNRVVALEPDVFYKLVARGCAYLAATDNAPDEEVSPFLDRLAAHIRAAAPPTIGDGGNDA